MPSILKLYTQQMTEGKKNTYPIDNRRKVGAKPRNIEVSRDKRLFAENRGRTIEKPMTQLNN